MTEAERDVLMLARAILFRGSYVAAESVMRAQVKCEGLTPDAMRLFEETLAKGCVHALVRLGGFRRIPRIVGKSVEPTRLWEAHPSFELSFSPFAFELFRWMVTQPVGKQGCRKLERGPKTMCDELLAYLTCAFVDGEALDAAFGAQPALRASALAQLGFPKMLAGAEVSAARVAAIAADGVVLEALQDDLARRAVAFERAKAKTTEPAELKQLGDARDATLTALLDALAKDGRLDLATFLVDAAVVLLPTHADVVALASQLVARLNPDVSLRDRAAARRASGAYLRALVRLGKHHEDARQARFFDEGYAASQLVLARWEHLGNDGFSRAAEVLTQLDALDRG